MLFFFEKIKNCFFLYVPFLIFQGLVIQRPIIISTNPGLVQLSVSLHSRDLFGIIFNCSQMVSRFWDIQSVGISKNATDNQRLQSVILTYTIYNLFFKLHLYNCNYKWNSAWPCWRRVLQKILTLPLFLKLFAIYTKNLKGRVMYGTFLSLTCKLFNGFFAREILMLNTHVQVMHVTMNIYIDNIFTASLIATAFVFWLWFGSPGQTPARIWTSSSHLSSKKSFSIPQ